MSDDLARWEDLPWLVNAQEAEPLAELVWEESRVWHVLEHVREWRDWLGATLVAQLEGRVSAAVRTFLAKLKEEVERTLAKPLLLHLLYESATVTRCPQRILVLHTGLLLIVREWFEAEYIAVTAFTPDDTLLKTTESRWSEIVCGLVDEHAGRNAQGMICLPVPGHRVNRRSQAEGQIVESQLRFVTPEQWGFDATGIWNSPNETWPEVRPTGAVTVITRPGKPLF